jgi:hypothetical protein
MSMTFDTKIAIVIRGDLASWQKLNVTAFIAGGLAGHNPAIVGEPYADASGNQYLPMIIQPIMIYQADAESIRKAYLRAMDRGVQLAIFTSDLFATGSDIDNRAAVADKPAQALDLVGLAMRDQKKTVDYVVKGLKLHP